MHEAIEFLQDFRPGGPWTLTFIVPDGRATTSTYREDQIKHLGDVLESRSGTENIYFQVNSAGDRNLTKKAKKEDIESAQWLHVDVDPTASPNDPEKWAKERAEIANRLKTANPPPTLIIDSGGGYQAFWHLNEPFVPNGKDWTDFERYNLQLAQSLGGDHCHNVDRIMRLPGTVNIPNKKKAAQGRVKAEAEIFSWDKSRIYSLGDFRQAAENVPVTGAVVVAANYDFDGLPLPDKVKAMALWGADPATGKKFPDRSKAIVHFACEAIRGGVDQGAIKAMLLDETLEISGHCLSQKDQRRAADRAIQKADEVIQGAREKVGETNPLEMINRDYFAIRVGGKTRFCDEASMELMDKTAFDYELKPEKIKTADDKTIPATRLWHDWKGRRYFRGGFTLEPGKGHGRSYNLWKGYGVEPIEGDVEPFLNHIQEVIEPAAQDYVWKWVYWTIQNPADKAKCALCLRGDEGTGKGFIGEALMRVFGDHALQLTQKRHVIGKLQRPPPACLFHVRRRGGFYRRRPRRRPERSYLGGPADNRRQGGRR